MPSAPLRARGDTTTLCFIQFDGIHRFRTGGSCGRPRALPDANDPPRAHTVGRNGVSNGRELLNDALLRAIEMSAPERPDSTKAKGQFYLNDGATRTTLPHSRFDPRRNRARPGGLQTL